MKTASLYLNVFIFTVSLVMSIFGILFMAFGWCGPAELFWFLSVFLAFVRSLVLIILYVVCEVFKKRKMIYWPAVFIDVIIGISTVAGGLYVIETDDAPAFAGMFGTILMFCSLPVVFVLFIVDFVMSIKEFE